MLKFIVMQDLRKIGNSWLYTFQYWARITESIICLTAYGITTLITDTIWLVKLIRDFYKLQCKPALREVVKVMDIVDEALVNYYRHTITVYIILGLYPISLILYHTNWVLNVGSLVFTLVTITNFLFALKSKNTLTKFNHLIVHLVLLSLVLLAFKNDQYVPLFLLTEFGTVFVIFNVVKSTHRTTSGPKYIQTPFFIVISVLSVVGFSNSPTYWIDFTKNWLTAPANGSDFRSLTNTLLDVATPSVLYIFTFLIVVTWLFIAVCNAAESTIDSTAVTKKRLLTLNIGGFNSITDYKAKTQNSSTVRFNK